MSSTPAGWDEAIDREKLPAGIPDPQSTPVPQALREEIEAHMALYPDRNSAALPALAAAQRVHGWCSPEAIEQVACVMEVTPASLAAVATFYDMLETSPVGRHSIYVCTNISCSLRGADALHEAIAKAAAETAPDTPSGTTQGAPATAPDTPSGTTQGAPAGAPDTPSGTSPDTPSGTIPDINVRPFECLGACDLAPMASVDGVYVGPLTLDDVPALISDVRAGRPVLPDKQLARMHVADPQANSREYPLHPMQTNGHGQATPDTPQGNGPDTPQGGPSGTPQGGAPDTPQGDSMDTPQDHQSGGAV